MQVMGSKDCARMETEMEKERMQGRGTYFGEAMELIARLQLQE